MDGIIAGLTDEVVVEFSYFNLGPEGAPEAVLTFSLAGTARAVIGTPGNQVWWTCFDSVSHVNTCMVCAQGRHGRLHRDTT